MSTRPARPGSPAAAGSGSGAESDAQAPRVQKAMARAGVASRREAERLMRAGRVRVNGKVAAQLGQRLQPGDVLEVSGQAVNWSEPRAAELWALYKPKRCVSTLDDPEGRSCLQDFLPPSAERLYPIGRLDYDAEGLILVTNDGELAQRVAHPAFEVPRCYLVKVKGTVQAATLARLAQGAGPGGPRRAAPRARVLHTNNDKTWLDVTLREGIHHQLKKMFAAVGHPVLKIKRYQIGAVELGELRPGQYRKLGKADMHRLLSADTASSPSGSSASPSVAAVLRLAKAHGRRSIRPNRNRRSGAAPGRNRPGKATAPTAVSRPGRTARD